MLNGNVCCCAGVSTGVWGEVDRAWYLAVLPFKASKSQSAWWEAEVALQGKEMQTQKESSFRLGHAAGSNVRWSLCTNIIYSSGDCTLRVLGKKVAVRSRCSNPARMHGHDEVKQAVVHFTHAEDGVKMVDKPKYQSGPFPVFCPFYFWNVRAPTEDEWEL